MNDIGGNHGCELSLVSEGGGEGVVEVGETGGDGGAEGGEGGG